MAHPPGRRPAGVPSRLITALLAAASVAAAPSQHPEPPAAETPPLAEGAFEQDVLITLADGRTFEGVAIEQTADHVRLRTTGGEMTISRSEIDDIALLDPLPVRYERMRRDIPEDDAAARLGLARWLRDRRAYAFALAEVDAALAVDPFNADAVRLRRWLELQIKLGLVREGEPDHEHRDDDGTESGQRQRRAVFPLIDREEVNLIRVYEVNLADPPRMQVDRKDIDALFDAYADNPLVPRTVAGRDALVRGGPARILDLMFRLQARDFYNRVRVIDDPAAIKKFRENIHSRWLIPRCATTECHGGADAGRLFLYNRRGNADDVVYTNFLILDRYILNDGTPLINHENPADSPLLQMALPRDLTPRPHPRIDAPRGRTDYKPVFVDTRQTTYEQTLDWIASLYMPRPTYPVDYEPPAPSAPLAVDQAPIER